MVKALSWRYSDKFYRFSDAEKLPRLDTDFLHPLVEVKDSLARLFFLRYSYRTSIIKTH